MIEPFITAFVLAFVSEIADKTQLIILGLALRYKSPLKIFAGALTAHALMDGLAIILGTFFGFSIPQALIKNVIGASFILLGAWSFAKLYLKRSKKEKKGILRKSPFAAAFLTVFLTEIGDKTQISSGLLAAEYLVPIPILFGVILALALTIGFNVFVGSKIAQKIPRRLIKFVAAALFTLFGVLTIISAH